MNDQTVINKIGLSKLFLWMEAERLESYPEVFARLQPNTTYTKKSLAIDTLKLISANEKKGKLVRGDFLNNIYGLDLTALPKISIRGVNALKEVQPGVYAPTEDALNIGEAFRNKDNVKWLSEFAQMVARYEVRTRLMLFLLGRGGYSLSFQDDGFFGSRSSRAEMIGPGRNIALFANDATGFNELLQTYRWDALGHWWAEEIQAHGLEIAQDFVFEGLRERKPPTNWLSGRLKISLFLMKYLGIIESQSSGWVVNSISATTILGEELAQDFVTVEFDHSPLEHFQKWHETLQDDLGFVIVSDLVRHWAEYKVLPLTQAEGDFDAWMRQQAYNGHIRIVESHPGQPRLGRGLYGDENARKIRFEITKEL